MIECVSESIYYKRKKRCRFKNKRLFRVFWFFLVFLALSVYYFYVIVPQIVNICAQTFKSYSADAVSKTALYSLNDDIKYENLVKIDKNDDGDIILLSVDALKVNRINAELAIKTRENLEEYIEKGVLVPIMAFSGLRLLSGYGPTIPFKAINITEVKCDFESEFEGVGINQTLHSLYVRIICTVSVNMPLNNRVSDFTTRVMISDSVIVGKVPDAFLNGKLLA